MRNRYASTLKTIPVLAAVALFFSACADKSLLRFQKIAGEAGKDNYVAAAQQVQKSKALYGEAGKLLYYMDLGILQHYAGQYDSSIETLSEAVKIQDDLFAKSVTNEAAATLTNDNIRPYRGKPYEIILLHEYLALDYLALGKPNDALVEARQAQLFLEEVQRKASKEAKEYVNDGMFHYLSAIIYEANKQRDDAAISSYKSIKAYRHGPIDLPSSVAHQTAATLKAAGRTEDLKELQLTDTLPAQTEADGAEIIVVGNAGRSPVLVQNAFWGTYVRDGALVIHYKNAKGQEVTEAIPAPGLPASELAKTKKGAKTRSGTTLHLKFSLPAFKEVPSQTKFFTIAGEASPNPIRTEPLTSLDPLLAQDLEANRSAVLIRTVIRVVLRTYAAEKTKSAVSGSNPLLNLFLNIGTDVLADQLEQADTRNWFLLPGTVQMARIPVKAGTHSFTVEAHNGTGQTLGSKSFENIQVKAGEKKFVFYTSLK